MLDTAKRNDYYRVTEDFQYQQKKISKIYFGRPYADILVNKPLSSSSVKCGWSQRVDFGAVVEIGPRLIFWHHFIKYKVQKQLWSVLMASMTACKYWTLQHIIEERFCVLSVWYLKQTICFCINIRIREGGFFPGRVYLFWQRMTDKNQIRSRKLQRVHQNRQQIFLCVFLPKLGLQSFELFSLATWDLSSPAPCAFLLSPFWLLWFMISLLPCY